MVISCTVREHWGKVSIAIDCNLLDVDPRHQEEARQLSSFLECVPLKVVDHDSGHSPVVLETNLAARRWNLDVFNFSYLLPGVWVPYGATIF